jgi:1-deoxy-D-xylulose-5-phosphate reductoisomerase
MAMMASGNQGAAPRGVARRVTILGSTGSVGQNTVDLLLRNPDGFAVEALTANRNWARLAEQARALRARFAAIADPAHYLALEQALAGTGIETAAGPQALIEAAERPADWVMAGIVGAAGLAPTLAAIRRGIIVALANKEVLVCAGALVMQEVTRCGATLLPVDSEHNAIWQCFDHANAENVERIILTASGGPFRERAFEDMRGVTREQAVAHPNWNMGAKISVDSATMMNKGLELIEAHHLFRLPPERVDIIVHPQSIVHSAVVYRDGSVLAQLGMPDMRTPIAYALAWPDRIETPTKRLDLAQVGRLTFEPPDEHRFPALRVAREALIRGGGYPTVLNAANEMAVYAFLEGRIGFLDIVSTVERTIETMPDGKLESLADVHNFDTEARQVAARLSRALASSRAATVVGLSS